MEGRDGGMEGRGKEEGQPPGSAPRRNRCRSVAENASCAYSFIS